MSFLRNGLETLQQVCKAGHCQGSQILDGARASPVLLPPPFSFCAPLESLLCCGLQFLFPCSSISFPGLCQPRMSSCPAPQPSCPHPRLCGPHLLSFLRFTPGLKTRHHSFWSLTTLQMKQSKSAYYGLELVGEETEGCLILEKDVQQPEDDWMAYTVYFHACFIF